MWANGYYYEITEQEIWETMFYGNVSRKEALEMIEDDILAEAADICWWERD